jgi:hypothetical protein
MLNSRELVDVERHLGIMKGDLGVKLLVDT